jgi:phenylacetate-CoA ligase
MNWRKPTYLSYATVRGYRFPSLLRRYRREHVRGAGRETAARALAELLRHCRKSVPYYARWLRQERDAHSVETDPFACLSRLPVLTKDIIRSNFAELQSTDLPRRRWSYNTSGGSTGEPVRLIQDREYEERCKAISLLADSLLGCDVGQPLARLWGSNRDIAAGTQSAKARFFNWLTNTTWMDAFQMSPERIVEFVGALNRQQPRFIVAYAQAAYEVARFVEREQLQVKPQRAVATSAGTLYPFMREQIARIFRCPVYNIYGSREVSLIGCEVPGVNGLWVPPWSNFVEILDDDGRPVSPGKEGNIVVTCLTNFAMPLIRYWIGDRGALARETAAPGHSPSQVLQQVSGRNVDVFRTRNRELVDGEYFTHLLYHRPWVGKFQVVQKAPEHVVFKFVKLNDGPTQIELEEIAAESRRVMGKACRVEFEFHGELPPHPSGKYRYTISEVDA